YTREGSITLSIRRKDSSGDQENAETGGKKPRILLAFEVADTGIGIKKEDMEKLFGNFTQFDKKQNRNIEGTGLGLAISRNLCLLMGGDIRVDSAYGQGSVFTALIPQLVEDDTPFALVEHPETKTALVYENRPLYAESIVYTIDNLGVGCAAARTRNDFVEQLAGGAWQFIFTSPALFDEVREILQNRNPAPGTEAASAAESSPPAEPALILLSEYGQAPRPDIRTVFMPLQPVAVANILNGQRSDAGYHGIETPGVRFIAPEARILIVDDIETNLNVAEGLLAPYRMRIDRAAGGLEAVHLVRENRYDLVLMDHMMPGMDGIEAAEAIRAWEKDCQTEAPREIPIIALTANAVSGMREMFLEKGFNDYISKPIEIAKLDDMMTRWIPAEKRIKAGAGIKRETFSGAAGIVIPGVDVKRGINMTGGTEAGYRKVLAQFYRDAAERLDWFRNFSPERGGGGRFPGGDPDPRDTGGSLAVFTAHVHALKSAAGTIGAAGVSEAAAALETAGKAGDTAAIRTALPAFREGLTRLVEGTGKALKTGTPEKREAGDEKKGEGQAASLLSSGLLTLRAALEAKNMREIDRLLGEIERLPLDEKDQDSINAVSDKVLMGEYQGAIETIDILLAAKGD
ncbi:MAG: response regulator, partial [Treponema sp.]|nr:response regulator [Treponema sp.]